MSATVWIIIGAIIVFTSAAPFFILAIAKRSAQRGGGGGGGVRNARPDNRRAGIAHYESQTNGDSGS